VHSTCRPRRYVGEHNKLCRLPPCCRRLTSFNVLINESSPKGELWHVSRAWRVDQLSRAAPWKASEAAKLSAIAWTIRNFSFRSSRHSSSNDRHTSGKVGRAKFQGIHGGAIKRKREPRLPLRRRGGWRNEHDRPFPESLATHSTTLVQPRAVMQKNAPVSLPWCRRHLQNAESRLDAVEPPPAPRSG
jgi:hypothetical protein